MSHLTKHGTDSNALVNGLFPEKRTGLNSKYCTILCNICFSNNPYSEAAIMERISELQRHIGTYGKTREIYAQYRKLTGRKREKFYEQHCDEIATCQPAKRYFNSFGLKKLMSI